MRSDNVHPSPAVTAGGATVTASAATANVDDSHMVVAARSHTLITARICRLRPFSRQIYENTQNKTNFQSSQIGEYFLSF